MKYRKKSPVVEAEQFWPALEPWPKGVEEDDVLFLSTGYRLNSGRGPVIIAAGDWVITDEKGKRSAVNQLVFFRDYEGVAYQDPE
jgi:hypothetical protein